jgi:hypothetical protein
MARIEREAIVADIAAVTPFIRRPFVLVTIGAKRLQPAEAEGVPVAAVGRDVIGDRRGDNVSAFATSAAQGFGSQLIAGSFLPPLQAVPFAPRQALSGVEKGAWHVGKSAPRVGVNSHYVNLLRNIRTLIGVIALTD